MNKRGLIRLSVIDLFHVYLGIFIPDHGCKEMTGRLGIDEFFISQPREVMVLPNAAGVLEFQL
jgi:hypothetical protein